MFLGKYFIAMYKVWRLDKIKMSISFDCFSLISISVEGMNLPDGRTVSADEEEEFRKFVK